MRIIRGMFFVLLPAVTQAQFTQQGPKLVGTGAAKGVGVRMVIGSLDYPGQGSFVSLSADGNTVATADSSYPGTGGVFFFTRSGTASNSQCTITGAGSAVGAGGNTLSVTLPITFTQAFGGNQIVFAAARNNNGQNSGWRAVGTAAVH